MGPWVFWLFPTAFAIHNIEEALWLPAWSQSAGRFHKPVGAFEFRFALVVLTSIAVVITALLCASGKQSIPSYLFFAFSFGMLVNVFAPHLTATLVLRRYCPGLLTGLLVVMPTTGFLLWFGYTKEYFLFPMFWYVTIPFAGLVIGSIPVLFKVGKRIRNLLDDSRFGG
jgi:hypothetical protein